MKTKTKNKRPKQHKPNLKGPYSVEPKKKFIDDSPSEPDKSKKSGEVDPAVRDRQE